MNTGSLEQYNSVPTYEEALDLISSLIIRRTCADGANKGDQFDLMFAYLKMLELEDPLSRLRFIHVAGTKGKGSTCTFTESILRSCGFHTGLFTSPHLIDLRERFKIDGVKILKEKFLTYFWWCWNRLKERTNENVPMPNYFRFLALLAFKIFAAEQVDVAILEVGLGGKFDPTNVVHAPVVCGISSLGYDHMEILGNTLGEIAGEKAGIFKHGVPAFTAPQPEEAMLALENKASELHVPLQIAPPLDISLLNGRQLGLAGEHQYINAGLAISLCHTWLEKTGYLEGLCLDQASCLPEQFIKGLETASLQGRAQIFPYLQMDMENHFCKRENNNRGDIIFYLDGAHSPESMEVCARWFSHAIKDSSTEKSIRILLFNCMPVRDPLLLLPRLINTSALHGIHFNKAIFVPNQSVFNKVGSHSLPSNDPPQVDLSWQTTLQRVWEDLIHDDIGAGKNITMDSSIEKRRDIGPHNIKGSESSMVFPSLPLALKWLRESAQRSQSNHFKVLVTGSLYLVGDVLRLIKK